MNVIIYYLRFIPPTAEEWAAAAPLRAEGAPPVVWNKKPSPDQEFTEAYSFPLSLVYYFSFPFHD